MVEPMSAAELRAGAILKRVTSGAKVAELGVWDGSLSGLLCQHVHLVMVDTWAPLEGRPASYIASGDPKASVSMAQMCAAMQKAHERVRGGRYSIQRMDTVLAASYHGVDSLDLVFIDADHSYEGVCRDIDAWLPTVKSGGYIGGHDFGDPNYPGVERAVRERFDAERIEQDANATWFVRI